MSGSNLRYPDLRNEAPNGKQARRRRRAFTEEDIALLRREYPTADLNELAANMGRTVTGLKVKASGLGIRRNRGAGRPKKEAQEPAAPADDAGDPQAAVAKLRSGRGKPIGVVALENLLRMVRGVANVRKREIRKGRGPVSRREKDIAVSLALAAEHLERALEWERERQ